MYFVFVIYKIDIQVWIYTRPSNFYVFFVFDEIELPLWINTRQLGVSQRDAMHTQEFLACLLERSQRT